MEYFIERQEAGFSYEKGRYYQGWVRWMLYFVICGVSIGMGFLADEYKQEGYKANKVAMIGSFLMAAGAFINGILTIIYY